MITISELRSIMPYLPVDKAALFAPALADAMAEFKIDTSIRQATFLAQLAHESGEFRYMEEIADGSAYNGRADLGNTTVEALSYSAGKPGPYFKGHGPIQITGYTNHRDCSIALFGDDTLLTNPRLLTEPVTGCRGAGWFWDSRNLNEYADKYAFGTVTKRINGGYNGLDDRCKYWALALTTLVR